MGKEKIRERLDRYKKWRRDRGQPNYIGPPVFNCDVDWLIDELERQLESNSAMRALLVRCQALFYGGPTGLQSESKLDLSITGDELEAKCEQLRTDIKTLLKKVKEVDVQRN